MTIVLFYKSRQQRTVQLVTTTVLFYKSRQTYCSAGHNNVLFNWSRQPYSTSHDNCIVLLVIRTVLFYLSRPPYCSTGHDNHIVLLVKKLYLLCCSRHLYVYRSTVHYSSTFPLFATFVCLQIYRSLQLNSSTFRDICIVVVFYRLENFAVLDSLFDSLFHCAHLCLIYSSRDSCCMHL